MSEVLEVQDSVRVGESPVRPRRLLVGAGSALVVNLGLFGLGSLAGVSWEAGQPSPVNVVAVIAATLLAIALPGAVTWAVARRWPGFAGFAAWAGLVVGVVSMAGPFSAADAATAASLAAMHLSIAIAWFVAVRPGGKA